MREKEIDVKGGSLYYVIREDGAHITRAGRLNGEILVPDSVEAEAHGMPEGSHQTKGDRRIPVVAVEKKAFLSQKKLRGISLPDSVAEIGEWAFAYCSNLEYVRLPKRKLVLGKGIFQECRNLERLETELKTERETQIAYLLAASAVLLDAEYLLTPEEAGGKEWLAKWDARMLELLHEDDLEGYTKMILCGEEDLDLDQDTFQKEKRRSKVRLCFLRLMRPIGLEGHIGEELKDYLLSHTKGCETEESWEVLLKEHGDEKEYYEFFCGLGCMTPENKGSMLEDMGEFHAEMKAFLLQYGQEENAGQDVFAGFEL